MERMAPHPPRRDLPRLTGIRAFAALSVFVFHVGPHWHVVDIPHAQAGYIGVGLFFILSGFVLTWSAETDKSARQFYMRRFARIYPSHLTVLIAAALLPFVQIDRTVKVAIPNLLLLQAWFRQGGIVYGMNGDSWSLSCEFAFYAAFPVALYVLLRSDRVLRWVLAGGYWAVMSTAVFAFHAHAELYYWPPVRFGEFLLGIAAALEMREGRRLRVPIWAALVVVVLAYGVSLKLPLPEPDAVMALPFLLLLCAAADRDIEARSGILGWRPIVYAGEASYAFYLVHELTIVNVKYLVGTGWGAAAIALAISCGAAVLLHHLVELPCQRAIVALAGRSRLFELRGADRAGRLAGSSAPLDDAVRRHR